MIMMRDCSGAINSMKARSNMMMVMMTMDPESKMMIVFVVIQLMMGGSSLSFTVTLALLLSLSLSPPLSLRDLSLQSLCLSPSPTTCRGALHILQLALKKPLKYDLGWPGPHTCARPLASCQLESRVCWACALF